MQFVILKDDYEVDEYGIEIKQEELPKINGQVPAGKIINKYVTTGEFNTAQAKLITQSKALRYQNKFN